MPEHDKKHDKGYDNTLSGLYSQTRNEPLDTTALDDKILAAAREELAGQQAQTRQQRTPPSKVVTLSGWRRWSTPLASAACLLLAVSLVFNVILYQQTDKPALLQAPFASIQGSEGVMEASVEAGEIASQDFALQPVAAPRVEKKAEQEYRRKQAAKPKAVSAAQANKLFQDFEEIVVTGSRVQDHKPLSPELERRVNGIIQLLKNGQLADARQDLMLLIRDHPELVKP